MTKVYWSDFVIWQCSLRQRNFRMFAGKPSDGTIAKIINIKTEKEICKIRSVLLEKNCSNTAKMFEFFIKQTHESEIRVDKAVKFLSSDYYNTTSNFDGSFTATFPYKSTIAKNILKQKITNVQFFEKTAGFHFPVNITKLKKTDPKWKYTFCHNFFFNPSLNENIEILNFSPIKTEMKKIN